MLFRSAGVVEQQTPRRALKVLKEIEVSKGDCFVRLAPSSSTTISFDIDFNSPVIRRQQAEVRLANGTFKAEIARARTFGFLHEVDQLRAAGLARGGSLDNAVVVSADGKTPFGPCAVNCSNSASIYGFHPGGANVLFVDGSVRFLKAGMSQELLVALVSYAGGEVLSPDDF